ncbi:hypothetical protein FEM48_Zijuj07G0171800 [Ziziphus jujuba var. spinosa]|uniref:Disease resistance R13L4/SHOC-2-like LRR domain-containing protein n=1 Tax=Ziziphus jujuba var. spinosa TaxID=714518 RepID=A0A978V5W9_ZIZJJ|nr:hypothetical protein FEM48_Zijuj07G0171800 [Ziziphus jujuba var. spinosa]
MVSLQHLDLSGTRLQGSIPETFGNNMTSLSYLDLSRSYLTGSIPNSLGNMTFLTHLNLRYNAFTGSIPESFGNLVKLSYLYLGGNLLEGRIPETLGNMPILEHLDLTNNTLEGEIPKSIWDICTLRELYMPSNILSGALPGLSLTSSSCKNHSLEMLDLRDNRIVGLFPYLSLFSFLKSLDLSSNQIVLKSGDFPEVDFSSNQLEGAIPVFLFSATLLHLSRNKFSDLSCLCDVKGRAGLVFLDISFNQLSGTLPNCWSSLDNLSVLNLAHNYNLSGKLPSSIGSLLYIRALHLGNNNFTGGLPSSWKNCSWLVAFDLGENNLSGPIPSWLGESLTKLAILVLRSNHFSGGIPSNICHLQSLQLLDLSVNNISGSLPMCVSNFTEMRKVGGIHATISYSTLFLGSGVYMNTYDKVEFVWKGILSEFGSTLGLVKSIDLSCNMLNGDIPSEITLLVGLVSLNLSRNNLSGQIPARIGNMRWLDFLDLSNNHLLGRIPQGLSLIDGMGVLNLSNNNLLGKIPTRNTGKLQSFEASTYMGNPGLCGDPLSNKCPGEEPTTPPRFTEEAGNGEDTDEFISHGFYASMGVGYAVGFWGVLGTLIFSKSWRFAYFKFLNDFANWIHVIAAVHKAKFLRTLRGYYKLLSLLHVENRHLPIVASVLCAFYLDVCGEALHLYSLSFDSLNSLSSGYLVFCLLV